jgi:hypothetical protein
MDEKQYLNFICSGLYSPQIGPDALLAKSHFTDHKHRSTGFLVVGLLSQSIAVLMMQSLSLRSIGLLG